MPTPKATIFGLSPRQLTAPITAFSMAIILFVYSRTSITAAKRNARQHREADGGQLNWENESMRRHGMQKKIADKSSVVDLAGTLRDQIRGKGGKD